MINTDETPADADSPEDSRIKARLKPYSEPLSLERIIGTSLFILAITKTITLFTTVSASPAVRVISIVALAYSISFTIFEVLVWSVALVNPGYSLEDVPEENILELLHYVDPGDNPFTFPNPRSSAPVGASDANLELRTVHASQPTSGVSSSHEKATWNKSVAVCTALLGVLGPLMWVFILTNIWKPNKYAFSITIAALAFLTLRLLGTIGVRFTRPQQFASRAPWLRQILAKTVAATQKLRQKPETKWSLYVLRWIWERATTVNLFSAIWIFVIGIYCVRLFPQHSLEGLGEPPEKPMWLDWLG